MMIKQILDRLNIFNNPFTTGGGLLVLIIGAILLGFKVITWDQFLYFVGLSGVGALLKDPLKKE
jgi:hypothetical protein